jgi:hypothetical protein
MMAITHGNPDAAKACVEIAMDELKAWRRGHTRYSPGGPR